MSEARPRAKKSLGQHFLTDLNYCRKVARFARIDPEDTVLEIGPGTGQMTRVLAENARRVIAVEFDRTMIQYLEQHWPENLNDPNNRLRLIQGDILTLDWSTILGKSPIKIIGNLPYNISTRILKKMTENKDRFHSATVMVQKEVAERVLADPVGKEYGYFTILMQYHFERVQGFDVPPGVFVPPPKVVSHVLKLIPREYPRPVADYPRFLKLIRRSFGKRRKTLWNNLKTEYSAGRLRQAFESCRIEDRIRPEAVTLDQYVCLARALS